MGIVGLEREYLDGLLEVAARRRDGQRIMVLFLGSTIGNFSAPADVKFLRDVRSILQSGDALLLGTDLEKPIPQLIDAYADPLGVTAAFNLNLLARMNRELDAGFDLGQFDHAAKFNPETRSIEMLPTYVKLPLVFAWPLEPGLYKAIAATIIGTATPTAHL